MKFCIYCLKRGSSLYNFALKVLDSGKVGIFLWVQYLLFIVYSLFENNTLVLGRFFYWINSCVLWSVLQERRFTDRVRWITCYSWFHRNYIHIIYVLVNTLLILYSVFYLLNRRRYFLNVMPLSIYSDLWKVILYRIY